MLFLTNCRCERRTKEDTIVYMNNDKYKTGQTMVAAGFALAFLAMTLYAVNAVISAARSADNLTSGAVILSTLLILALLILGGLISASIYEELAPHDEDC